MRIQWARQSARRWAADDLVATSCAPRCPCNPYRSQSGTDQTLPRLAQFVLLSGLADPLTRLILRRSTCRFLCRCTRSAASLRRIHAESYFCSLPFSCTASHRNSTSIFKLVPPHRPTAPPWVQRPFWTTARLTILLLVWVHLLLMALASPRGGFTQAEASVVAPITMWASARHAAPVRRQLCL